MIHFSKYQGTGNDFVMIDDRSEQFDIQDHALVARLCDRKFGIGADGLILLRPDAEYDFRMVYFNSDGYESSFCGNGGRCVVRFAYELGLFEEHTVFRAYDGKHEAYYRNGIVSLKMNEVREVKQTGDHFFLHTGSPHYVRFQPQLADFDVVQEGSLVRYSAEFAPAGTNVNFVEKLDSGKTEKVDIWALEHEKPHILVRTYERGVENETLSCGTGVTACALVYGLQTAKSPVIVRTLGGMLAVSFRQTETGFEDIYLTGKAEKVFEGNIA